MHAGELSRPRAARCRTERAARDGSTHSLRARLGGRCQLRPVDSHGLPNRAGPCRRCRPSTQRRRHSGSADQPDQICVPHMCSRQAKEAATMPTAPTDVPTRRRRIRRLPLALAPVAALAAALAVPVPRASMPISGASRSRGLRSRSIRSAFLLGPAGRIGDVPRRGVRAAAVRVSVGESMPA
jgi:hypothetical protein